MMILGDQRYRLIESLGFNDKLKALTKGNVIHSELEFRCMSLKYSLEPEDFCPDGIDVIPLWESESSITGFYLDDLEKPIFIHYGVESIEDYKVLGSSISDLVNFLVSEYVDYAYEDEVRDLLVGGS